MPNAKQEARSRRDVVATARAMSQRGLSPGRSGNVSCRFGDGMLITPTAVPYETLAPDQIVAVDSQGGWSPDGLAPSSEWRFHVAAYQARPDASAVVHCHSLHATALACTHRGIPAFHYMVAVAGGTDIPCVPYALFGTEALAAAVAEGLAARKACLMANHGQIATGRDLEAALDLASEVETLAAQYIAACAIGDVHLLDAIQMDEVLERFQSYGQPRPGR